MIQLHTILQIQRLLNHSTLVTLLTIETICSFVTDMEPTVLVVCVLLPVFAELEDCAGEV